MKYLLIFGLLGITATTHAQSDTMNWIYPYDVQTVELPDAKRIAYIDEGEGTSTLLFIHGLGSYLRAWQKNIDALQANYRCIALDLPGYGKSAAAVGPQTMPFFAETVLQLIEALDLQQVTLVGHSMGGQIAMHTVLTDSSAIDRLVLMAPAGFETFSESDRAFFNTYVTPEIIKASTEEQIRNNFNINFYDMPEDAQFMVADRLKMRATDAYEAYCNMIPKCVQGMLEAPVADRLGDISLPTLVFFGEADRLIPNTFLHSDLSVEKVAQSGATAIPNSRLVMVPKAGHFVQWEGEALVNKTIIDFVEE